MVSKAANMPALIFMVPCYIFHPEQNKRHIPQIKSCKTREHNIAVFAQRLVDPGDGTPAPLSIVVLTPRPRVPATSTITQRRLLLRLFPWKWEPWMTPISPGGYLPLTTSSTRSSGDMGRALCQILFPSPSSHHHFLTFESSWALRKTLLKSLMN